MSVNKSPGLDRCTIEFYRHFWPDIKFMLLNAFKECITNMSLSMKHGVITLLPKSGKDPFILDSWRPITLLACDYT